MTANGGLWPPQIQADNQWAVKEAGAASAALGTSTETEAGRFDAYPEARTQGTREEALLRDFWAEQEAAKERYVCYDDTGLVPLCA